MTKTVRVTTIKTTVKKMKQSRLITAAASIHSRLIFASFFTLTRSSSSNCALRCSRSRIFIRTGSDEMLVLTGVDLAELSSTKLFSTSSSASDLPILSYGIDRLLLKQSSVASQSQMILLTFKLSTFTRNTLDCDQSNYSSRIVSSHISIDFGQTGVSAIRSADLENPTVEPNMKWIERPLAEIWPFEIFQNACEVGRRPVIGRSVLNILLLTLFSYTPLRYVKDVVREE